DAYQLFVTFQDDLYPSNMNPALDLRANKKQTKVKCEAKFKQLLFDYSCNRDRKNLWNWEELRGVFNESGLNNHFPYSTQFGDYITKLNDIGVLVKYNDREFKFINQTAA